MHGSTGRRAVGCKPGGDDGGWQREAGVWDCGHRHQRDDGNVEVIMLGYYKNGGMYI